MELDDAPRVVANRVVVLPGKEDRRRTPKKKKTFLGAHHVVLRKQSPDPKRMCAVGSSGPVGIILTPRRIE